MFRRVYRTQIIDGIIVSAYDDDRLDRVVKAIHIIQTHDRLRYRRLSSDIERIWVCTLGRSVGRFARKFWMCKLNEAFVAAESTTPELLASVIVHEATHARLYRMGFGYDEKVRARVEAVCLRRELAFAARIPSRIPGQWAQASLDTPYDYTDAAVERRVEEDFRETARKLGMPTWLTRIVIGTARPLRRRRRRLKQRTAARYTAT